MHIFVDVDGRILDTSTKFILARTKDVNLPEFLPTLQHFRSHLWGWRPEVGYVRLEKSSLSSYWKFKDKLDESDMWDR